MKQFAKYSKKVVGLIDCDYKVKRRIREDVMEMLESRYEETGIDNPVELIGTAEVVAAEFRENLPISSTKSKFYNSRLNILGIPLLSITFDRNFTAKGIIAIGSKSIGVISIGGAAIGCISIGGAAIGVFSFGGLALGLAWGFGGVAIAFDVAIGGVAIANSLALGGIAVAKKVAIGGLASAELMGYMQHFLVPKRLSSLETHSYMYPEYRIDLGNTFREMFPRFGNMKSELIEILTRR